MLIFISRILGNLLLANTRVDMRDNTPVVLKFDTFPGVIDAGLFPF